MKKSLYNEDETYSPEAFELSSEATRIIQPLFDKYIKDGYSIRQISHVITTAVWECELMGMFNRK